MITQEILNECIDMCPVGSEIKGLYGIEGITTSLPYIYRGERVVAVDIKGVPYTFYDPDAGYSIVIDKNKVNYKFFL